MELILRKGRYIVAVSGGVDSMTLLFLINKFKTDDQEFVVAHFNHGIRRDSNIDEELVKKISEEYDMPFVSEKVNLGKDVSEDEARKSRMKFLNRVKEENDADYILTAHHKDDLIETALINTLRGTGRRGLNSLISSKVFIRPLIKYSKEDILKFAKTNNILWHEDSTNSEDKYLRNYIRLNIIPKMDEVQKENILGLIDKQNLLNEKIDDLLNSMSEGNSLDRHIFSSLSYSMAKEVMLSFIRKHGVYAYDKKLIDRITTESLIQKSGKTVDVNNDFTLKLTKEKINIIKR